MHNFIMNLRLFDEGAEGTGDLSGVENVVYGIQDDTPAAGAADQHENPVDVNAEFDQLIGKGGKYADVFNQRMTGIIQKRLGNAKSMQQKYEAQQPLIDALMTKYGVDDVSKLQAAIDEDESFYEDAAYEKGMTVEQYKRFARLERENNAYQAQLREQEEAQGAQQTQAQWFAESQALKESIPDFDFQTELQNPAFAEHLRRGLSVMESYRLTHYDDLMASAQQRSAQIAQQRAAVTARQNAARPTENLASVRTAQRVVSDPSKMSREDILAAIELAKRGKDIRF